MILKDVDKEFVQGWSKNLNAELMADLAQHLSDMKAGKKVKYTLSKNKALRVTGVGAGAFYYIICRSVSKNSGQFEFIWSGSPHVNSVSSPDQTFWEESAFQLAFREVEVERGVLGIKRHITVELGWLA